jgi:hypothetical protein
LHSPARNAFRAVFLGGIYAIILDRRVAKAATYLMFSRSTRPRTVIHGLLFREEQPCREVS